MATPIPENRLKLTLREVAAATGGALHGDPDLAIEGVAIDSRSVGAGGLFVAVRGENQDGHRFVAAAISQGAAAVLVQTGVLPDLAHARVEVADTTRALGDLGAYVRKRWGRKVVSITGSAGKTTTKELTAAALAATSARVLKTAGNLNNQFGVPMTLFGLTDDHDVAVLEVGTSRRGEIARLGEITQPDVAVVLLAAPAHTQGLGTVAEVAEEKASLWRALPEDGTAIVNADDSLLVALVPQGAHSMSFGTSDRADVRLVSCHLTTRGTDVRMFVRGHGEVMVTLQLLGAAAALDACAALLATLSLCGEACLPAAVKGLGRAAPTLGRMWMTAGLLETTLLDDSYNANPRSVEFGLQTVKQLAESTGGRSVAVLGDMGDLGAISRAEHERIGEAAVRMGIDVLVGCGGEMAHATAQAARLSGGRLAPHPTRVAHVLDPLDSISIVKSLLRAGDVVLVKGSRSMAMERIVDALSSMGPGASP